MTKDYIKDIPNWEEQYLATDPQLTVREKEQLKEEVTLLRRRLEYYKTIVEVDEEEK